MTVVVRQAAAWQDVEAAFCESIDLVYGNDSHYVRPSRESLRRALQRREFEGRQRFFVAERNHQTVARLVARLPADANSDWATIGEFESVDDSQAAAELLRTAVDWLRELGARQVIGPMEGDTWHRYRFSTGPFDEPPFLMEPYNPAHYPALWQAAGFERLESYHSKRLDDVPAAVSRFESIHDRLTNRGYLLEPFDVQQFDDELDRLYRLSLAIFSANKLYTPITADEFRKLYTSARRLIDRRLVWFARSPDGEDVGFVFALRDYHAAAVAMRGGEGWFAKLRFLAHKRKATAINVKSLGVVPGQRNSGIGVALVSQVYRQMLAMGFRRANLCLIHDENPSSRLDAGLGSILRRYELYHYQRDD